MTAGTRRTLAALGMVFLWAVEAEGQDTPPAKPAQGKTPIVEKGKEQSPALAVTLTAKKSQKAKGGIEFLVELANKSDAPISLYDPSDVMIVSLVDKLGYPCALPPVPSLLMTKTSDPVAARKELDRLRAFVLRETSKEELGEGAKTMRDLSKDGEVLLGPGERFVLAGRISTILADPDAYLKAAKKAGTRQGSQGSSLEPEVKPVPPGPYKLRVLIPMISKGAGQGAFLSSDEVAVEVVED